MENQHKLKKTTNIIKNKHTHNLTYNPNSNTNTNDSVHNTSNNILPTLLKNQSSGNYEIANHCSQLRPQYLNSFYYHDHITNNLMAVGKDMLFSNIKKEQYKQYENNSVVVDDDKQKKNSAKIRYSHKDTQNSCVTIKQCFDLMKSTRKFHLSSIQAKNYKIFKNGNKCDKYNSKLMNSSKYSTSFNFNDTVHSNNISNLSMSTKRYAEIVDCDRLSKQKLQRYYKNKQQQKVNFKRQKLMLSKMLQSSFNFVKNTQNKIIENTQQNESCNNLNSGHNIQKKRIKNKKTSIQPSFISDNKIGGSEQKSFMQCFKNSLNKKNNHDKQNSVKKYRQLVKSKKQSLHQLSKQKMESQIIKDATAELRYMVRKNGEFLITPDINKRLALKNKKQCNQGSRLMFNQERFSCKNRFFHKDQLNQYTFKNQNQDVVLRKMRLTQGQKPSNCTNSQQMKESEEMIISCVESGNYFRTQIELSVNPQLLLTKQKTNNNNLLHICVMNNKQQLFQMILRKCREQKIDLLAQTNKYGRSPLQLGKVLSFFKKKQILQLLHVIQKQKIKGAYNLLASIFNKKQ